MYDGFAIHLIQIKGDVKGAPITLTPPLTRIKDEVKYMTALHIPLKGEV